MELVRGGDALAACGAINHDIGSESYECWKTFVRNDNERTVSAVIRVIKKILDGANPEEIELVMNRKSASDEDFLDLVLDFFHEPDGAVHAAKVARLGKHIHQPVDVRISTPCGLINNEGILEEVNADSFGVRIKTKPVLKPGLNEVLVASVEMTFCFIGQDYGIKEVILPSGMDSFANRSLPDHYDHKKVEEYAKSLFGEKQAHSVMKIIGEEQQHGALDRNKTFLHE